MTPPPKSSTCCLALVRWGEEKIQKSLDHAFPGLRICRGGVLTIFGIRRRLAPPRSGSDQYKAPYEPRMPKSQGLGNVSTDREPQEIDFWKPEGRNEVGSVVCHCIDGIWSRAA